MRCKEEGVPQETADEVLGISADVAPFGFGKLVLARTNTLLHAWRDGSSVVGVKRRVTAQQDVRNDTQGPKVARLVVQLWAENLGRHVVWCVARRLQRLSAANLLGKAEISQLQNTSWTLLRVQQILRLKQTNKSSRIFRLLFKIQFLSEDWLVEKQVNFIYLQVAMSNIDRV